MNYTDSISDFFKSPNWAMNMVFGGLCMLIPIVGPIVVLGWLVTGLWGRQDQSYETFPAFDFSHFGKYLERGVWPFLVTLVASWAIGLVLFPCVWILAIPAMLTGGFSSQHQSHVGGCFAAFAMMLSFALIAVMMVVLMFALFPLKIRAALTQDFAKSFDFRFIRRFISLTWLEMALSALFLVIISPILSLLGAIVFCVGVMFANVLIYFAWAHLHKQLYALYLSRGGEPVPVSPKLSDPLATASGV